jgi:hypothetical protein
MAIPPPDRAALLTALASLEKLRRLIEEEQYGLVARARASGATWREIGDLYGISPQAARQRFVGQRRRDPS